MNDEDCGDYVLRNAVSTSRGCHFRCEFCYESSRHDPVYRRKPLAYVLAEIDSRPGPVIAFLDNDLLGDKRYARRLLEALIPRQKHWMAMTTIRFADDPQMVSLAAAAGCRTLFIGFESVSTESLHEVGKRQNQVELYRLQAEGRIFDHNWSHYDTTRAVFEPVGMTAEELEAGYFHAYRKFYSLDSILTRAFRPGSGSLQRLALNLAYKRVEPMWKSFELGLPAKWVRPMTYWYMHPPRAQRVAMREIAQARLATN